MTPPLFPRRARRPGSPAPAPDPRALVGGTPHAVLRLRVDGREVPAEAGRSVAAALWAAGFTHWRTTRTDGAPRGLFCGIGVCHDCLVTVNDEPNLRACLVPARDGDRITTQEGHGHADLTV
ncbi:(2Fe-2S)-binding protein [Streptomyces sp. BI20]|uniref:(2Fe-2S)-binding protein n=1 Tax=Streptomyces sp. BI20 TaxID=3403460 RepID=UPI003C78007D